MASGLFGFVALAAKDALMDFSLSGVGAGGRKRRRAEPLDFYLMLGGTSGWARVTPSPTLTHVSPI